MLTPADLLARGLGLVMPAGDPPPEVVPPGECCAITGAPLAFGYRCTTVTTDATSEFVDTFGGRYGSGYVSEAAAACYRSSNPRTGNPTARSHLVIDLPGGDVLYMSPMVSRESAAAQGRPCWSDAVRAVWPEHAGRVALVHLTDDFKKRLWPYATVGAIGGQTPVYIHDTALFAVQSVIRVDWPAMIECLDLLERIYALGFSKPAIARGLLTSSKAVAAVSLRAAVQHERALAAWRGRPEFMFALIIAQIPAPQEGAPHAR